MIYFFNEKDVPKLSEIGGKAKTLMETTQKRLPVPNGFLLSVSFFEPWLKTIKSSKAFQAMLKDTTKTTCDVIVDLGKSLTFSETQSKLFNDAVTNLNGTVFAVRSSSPEEDLEGSSFAGMYETYLGTLKDDLEMVIAKAFASCFDYRVMAYKSQHAMPLEESKIAIIVQEQIPSEISGVGFSLNPLNNCYDEVMINASFGLGEAIVSGIVTPDQFVYDVVAKKIIEEKISEKSMGLWLNEGGGIIEKTNHVPSQPSLSPMQVEKLACMIKDCESIYGFPVDIEWAYHRDTLYLLQARPITTYIPFFEELLTKPGEKKRFYLDIMIMTQGFSNHMSVLGLEIWAKMLDDVKAGMMSNHIHGTTPSLHGRQYMSFTDMQKIMGKKNAEKIFANYDGNVKRIFDTIDLTGNFPDKKPVGTEKFKSRLFKMGLKMLPGVIGSITKGHEAVLVNYHKKVDELFETARNLSKEEDFAVTAGKVSEMLLEITNTISVMLVGMIYNGRIKKMFKGDDIEKEIVALSMDLEGNPTSAMGHLLFKLACYDEFQNLESREAFIEGCEARNFSEEFLKDYDEFMLKYAVRGMQEIDVASKRVYEDVGMLYDKLIEINIQNNQILDVKAKREKAYEKLRAAAKAKGKEKKFVKLARVFQGTFGYREHPKYVIVYILGMMHGLCLEIGQDFVTENRLDEVYHIFDLNVFDIAEAQKTKSIDLREKRDKNLEGYRKVAQVKDWPLVIDSRGKIYKPKIEIKDGDIKGDPIAPGKVIGRAKVLNSPYEKSLEPGEILIARATEPSWTPIFINASGVIMEIGGPLQHGGIIAREYGIPCVSGLIGIMDMVKDGDLLEVDGYNGVVKILES